MGVLNVIEKGYGTNPVPPLKLSVGTHHRSKIRGDRVYS